MSTEGIEKGIHSASWQSGLPADQFVLFDASKGEPESLEQAVQLAVGAASACWENLSGAGVFQSERALEVSDQLIAWLRGIITSHKIDEALLQQYRKAIDTNRDTIIRLENELGMEKQQSHARAEYILRRNEENATLRRTLVAMDSGWVPSPHVPPQQAEFVQAALEELNHARAKHGEGCIDGEKWSDSQRLAIILEELGEVAKELNDEALDGNTGPWSGHLGRLLGELIQVVAMGIGWGAMLMPGTTTNAAPQQAAEPTPAPAVGGFTTGRLGRVHEAYEPGSTVRVPQGAVAVMVPRDRLHNVLELLDPRA